MTKRRPLPPGPALVDTTVFLAAVFPREKHHQEGAALLRAIEAGTLGRPVLTDYILDETVTFVRRKKGAMASVETLDTLLGSPRLTLLKIGEQHFEAGIQLFRAYERLSFTDAASVAVMHERNIPYIYSFDADFDGIPRVTRVTVPPPAR